jgi:hypothetical protein
MNAKPKLTLHPLLRLFRPTVATRSIERLADAINSSLDMGYRGLSVYGFARFGKTEGKNYLIQYPEWLFPRTAALLQIDVPDTHKRTDRSFYQSFLTLLGLRIPNRATPDELCAMIMGKLIEECKNRHTRLVIVFFDEAQRLLPTDYESFVTIDNRMTQAGYYFFTVFINQRDITGFSNEKFDNTEHPPHVTGRFLIRKHEFKGICDEEEAAYVLNRYDKFTEWPPGSNVSYTEYFAPQAVKEGFCLAQFAPLLWEEAENLRAEVRLPPEWTWPMKSFEATVIYLLTVVIPETPNFENFTDENILAALHASGLIELELSRHAYKPGEPPKGTRS